MSIRGDVKELITHFIHDKEYTEERTKWRGLVRTMKTAADNVSGRAKKRKRKDGDASPSTAASERASEGSQT